MALTFTTSYIEDSLAVFRQYKALAEKAMAQVTDEQLLKVLDGEMNSIAIIVKHMAGNMRSRWTDFLTTDGEKPNRNRDSEFVDPCPNPRGLTRCLGRRLGPRLYRARIAVGRRSSANHHHTRRDSFRHAGHQPPDCPLRLSLRSDRASRQTLRPRSVAIFDGPSRPIPILQQSRARRRSKPTLVSAVEYAQSHRLFRRLTMRRFSYSDETTYNVAFLL